MSRLIVKDLSIFAKKEERPIVCGMSFQIDPGESLVLLGQSGCGKTMTCRAILGLLDKKLFRVEGSISFENTELATIPEKKRAEIYGKQIAFVPQNPMTALDPSVRIGKQMEETLKRHTDIPSGERKKAIHEALLEAGLDAPERICKALPYTLSGGMLQRVLIAMAMSTDANLVIADEPTTALDVVHRNEIVDSFLRLREKGAAVLFVTHDFAAALRLGGNVLIMENGKAVEEGKTRKIYERPETDYTKALIKACALSKEEIHADS